MPAFRSLSIFLLTASLFIELPAQAASQKLWECKYWQSKNNLIRVNLLKTDAGELRATFNDGPSFHMTSISTGVTLRQNAAAIVVTSKKPGSAIKSLKLEISPDKPATTRSPLDGQDFVGADAELQLEQVNLNRPSGLETLRTRLVCRKTGGN